MRAKSLHSCPTLCDPINCSPPGPSVLGDSPGKNTGVGCHAILQGIFSTQGSNPGLPHCRWIPYRLSHQGSPIFRAAAAAAKSLQSCPTLCDPIDCSPPGSPVPGILQARILQWVAMPSSRGSSKRRDQTQVSRIAGRFLTSELSGKPKNTGVGSLSLHRGKFQSQESNWGLLHCRWILSQLSHQGSP